MMRSSRARCCRSPQFRSGAAGENFGDALARRARNIFRQLFGREEAVGDDLAVGLRWRNLPERAHDIERDMVTPRQPAIEIDGVKDRRFAQFDIALFAQFALQRRNQRLADFDAAARQMPATDVGVLYQEDAALAVEDKRADA